MTNKLIWTSCATLTAMLAISGCSGDGDTDGTGASAGAPGSGGDTSGTGGGDTGGTGGSMGGAGPCDGQEGAALTACEDWVDSAHADETAEAFRHFDEDGAVGASCARCHTSTGFERHISGQEAMEIELGEVIECQACHNDTASALTEVTFPSGVTVQSTHADGATCMTCHQGRSAGQDVDTAIDGAAGAPATADSPSSGLSFINIHYYAAAASLYGTVAGGGYEYEGQTYVGKNTHGDIGPTTCTDCHNQHSLEIRLDDCTSSCHSGQAASGDPRDLMGPSASENHLGDIETLQGELMAAMQQNATDTTDVNDICYDASSYPYWFVDSNTSGDCDGSEAEYSNQFRTWTPRLLRAAYNYQVSLKDPGSFAHNPDYHMQLLYDSVEDLGATPSVTRPE